MNTTIKNYEDRLKKAMISHDCEELDVLMSADLLFINYMGQQVTKEEDINAHRKALFSINNITFRSQKILGSGDNVLVVSDADLELNVSDGIIKDHLIYTRL